MYIAGVAVPVLAGERGYVAEAFDFALKIEHLIVVQQIGNGACAEDEIDLVAFDIVVVNVADHAAERGDARACANEEMFFVFVGGQSENALRAAQCERVADLDVLENVARPYPTVQMHYDKFNDIGAIGHGSDAVAAPALVALLVDGEIEGDELTGDEIEIGFFGHFYPIPACVGRSLFYVCNNSFLPSRNHGVKGSLFCGRGI